MPETSARRPRCQFATRSRPQALRPCAFPSCGHEADRPRRPTTRLPDSSRGRSTPQSIGQVGLPLGQRRPEPAGPPSRWHSALSKGAARAVASGPGAGAGRAATVAQSGACRLERGVVKRFWFRQPGYGPFCGPIAPGVEEAPVMGVAARPRCFPPPASPRAGAVEPDARRAAAEHGQ